ncbi:unnamed protein product [Polarella glacialis]|uniref:RWD domain-containing protein n=1 Tax=Polarella glacialis TaxID=89957 RepID=A0A813E550_POLGL|nr:unnamed protein product [Polarella glacialis]
MEQRSEEREVLEAIYGEDFVVLGDAEWSLRLCEGHGLLQLDLPEGYPHDAPVPCLHSGDRELPAGFSERVAAQLLESFEPGKVCVHEWAMLVEEALQQFDTRDEAGDASSEGLQAVSSEQPSAEISAAECSVAIASGVAAAVGASLLGAGFASCGPGIYSHAERGVTVEVGDLALSISVDGIDSQDLQDFATLQLESVADFGPGLLGWTTAQRSAEPGFGDEEEGEEKPPGLEYLPDPQALGVKTDRELGIYTWGKALRKAAPPESQFNFNAGVLNGRGGGADLRTMNGLSEEVQRNVASCGLFPRWLEMVIHKVESANLSVISINCTKGRHRSVAAAEILRSVYYPQATIKHLTIY